MGLKEVEQKVLKALYKRKVASKIELAKSIGKSCRPLLDRALASLLEKRYIRRVTPVSVNCFVITQLGEQAVEERKR